MQRREASSMVDQERASEYLVIYANRRNSHNTLLRGHTASYIKAIKAPFKYIRENAQLNPTSCSYPLPMVTHTVILGVPHVRNRKMLSEEKDMQLRFLLFTLPS